MDEKGTGAAAAAAEEAERSICMDASEPPLSPMPSTAPALLLPLPARLSTAPSAMLAYFANEADAELPTPCPVNLWIQSGP